MKQLSQEQIEQILCRYGSRETLAAIAADYGVNPAYPGKLARRHGLPLRKPGTSQALLARHRIAVWKPEPEAPLLADVPRGDIRRRVLAGEPLVIIAADFDLGLMDVVAAARAAP